jgi:hypothetical protein
LGDFYWICGGVCPGIREVGGIEAGIVGEAVGFGVAELAGLDDDPNGDAGVGNAGIAATNAGCFFDACPSVAEALDEDLDGLGFFGGGEGEELGLEVLEWHGGGSRGSCFQCSVLGGRWDGVESGSRPNSRILFSLGCRTFRMGEIIMGVGHD